MHFSFAQTARIRHYTYYVVNASGPGTSPKRDLLHNMACFENMEWPDEKVLENVFALAWGGWLGNQTKQPNQTVVTAPHPHCL